MTPENFSYFSPEQSHEQRKAIVDSEFRRTLGNALRDAALFIKSI